jgi:hypothetical protein
MIKKNSRKEMEEYKSVADKQNMPCSILVAQQILCMIILF